MESDELPRPGTCHPFELVEVLPVPGDRMVRVDTVPTLTFSDFPDPDTVGLATLSLTISGLRYTGSYKVDLVDRRVFFEPTGWLQPGIGFTMILRPEVRSLRGCRLEPPPPYPNGEPADAYYLRFHTLDPDVEAPPRDVPPPAPTFSEVQDLFAGRCAGGCHADEAVGPDPGACLAAPAAGLSLCPAEAHASLVGVPSRQVVRLVRVAPRDSARSYLLRKLLGAPPLVGHLAPPGGALTPDELHLISRWIDAGAAP